MSYQKGETSPPGLFLRARKSSCTEVILTRLLGLAPTGSHSANTPSPMLCFGAAERGAMAVSPSRSLRRSTFPLHRLTWKRQSPIFALYFAGLARTAAALPCPECLCPHNVRSHTLIGQHRRLLPDERPRQCPSGPW